MRHPASPPPQKCSSAVQIDAMGCQTAIARQVVAQGGDYVLALKENQPDVYREAVHLFAYGRETGFVDQTETENGLHISVTSRLSPRFGEHPAQPTGGIIPL